jgi:predicted DsbA family dithiol-disulfide isomerase
VTTGRAPVIEVYADLWCPFAYVGLLAIAEQRTRSGRDDVVIRVRAWPLELVNGIPLQGDRTKAHADELRAQVAPQLFAHLDLAHFPTSTLEALALVERAYRSGPRCGERASFALRRALFEQGRDLSQPAVLEGLADELGVSMPDETDRAAVLDDWHEGRARGVRGSPHVFCGGADLFCPALDITSDPLEGVTIRRNVARLTGFLAHCLEQPCIGERRAANGKQ